MGRSRDGFYLDQFAGPVSSHGTTLGPAISCDEIGEDLGSLVASSKETPEQDGATVPSRPVPSRGPMITAGWSKLTQRGELTRHYQESLWYDIVPCCAVFVSESVCKRSIVRTYLPRRRFNAAQNDFESTFVIQPTVRSWLSSLE